MRRVIFLYSFGALLCFIAGIVVALSVHYSWWFLLLLSIPISFGLVSISDISMNIDNHIVGVTILSLAVFVGMLAMLMFAAYYRIDEQSFWGMVYVVGVGLYTLGVLFIIWQLPGKWTEKRRRERKNLYGLKSTSYGCRFF